MFSLLLTGAVLLQQPNSRPPVLPNHRFILTHEPKRQILSAEWWCYGSTLPSSSRFEIRSTEILDATGRPTSLKTAVSLLTLTVGGKPASETTLREVRERLAPLKNMGVLHGRCLHKPSGRTAPVLEFHGYVEGTIEPQMIEVELGSE